MGDATSNPTCTSSQVAIIGAGPVGLYTALLLGRAGIDVQIFEKGIGVERSPRALGYFPVVLEDFKRSGIFDDVCKASLINNTGLSWRRPKNGGILAHIGPLDPTKFVCLLGQPELADLILEHLKRLPNVTVNFDTCLERFEALESEDRVQAHLVRGSDGASIQHVSRFLVGADGGRSMVRKLSNIPLEGFTWEDWDLIAANIVYDLESYSDWGPVNHIVDPDNWAATVANLEKGPKWRVSYGERKQKGVPEEPWDVEKALERLRRKLGLILPGPVEQAKIIQISPYKMHQRCASTFRQGNIVLAGDAAHLTNPCGGLGLATGLMDASLLGRVLIQILNEGQSTTLLDTYSEKRRAVFLDFTSPTATANFKRLWQTDPATNQEREELFAKLNKPDIPFLKKLFEAELNLASTLD